MMSITITPPLAREFTETPMGNDVSSHHFSNDDNYWGWTGTVDVDDDEVVGNELDIEDRNVGSRAKLVL
jgi:hypothetical protein